MNFKISFGQFFIAIFLLAGYNALADVDVYPWIYSSTPSGFAYQNNSIQVSTGIINTGSDPAPSSVVKYYLSTDQTLSGNDFFLYSQGIGTINPGAWGNLSPSINIPLNSPYGQLYLLVEADGNDDISESDETNNVYAYEVEIIKRNDPDLTLTIPSINPVYQGDVFSLGGTFIQNLGAVSSPSSSVKYYLSTDNIKDAGDNLLINYSIPSISASGAVGGPTQITMPNVSPGNYFIIGIVDESQSITELNESNNKDYIEVEVLLSAPDYVVSSVQEPLGASTGETCTHELEGEDDTYTFTSQYFRDNDFMTFDFYTENIGKLNSEYTVNYDVYFSEDNKLNKTNDILITNGSIPPLAVGQSPVKKTINFQLYNWYSSSTGLKYIIVKVDAPEELDEIDEDNNLGLIPFCFQTDSEGPEGKIAEDITNKTMSGRTSLEVVNSTPSLNRTLFKVSSFGGIKYEVVLNEGAFDPGRLPKGFYVFYYRNQQGEIFPEKVYIQ